MSETNFSTKSQISQRYVLRVKTALNAPFRAYFPYEVWSLPKVYVFRFTWVFLLYFIVPVDWKFYQYLFSIHWVHLHFYDVLVLAKYQPEFVSLTRADGSPVLGWSSYSNWLIGFLVAVIGAILWSIIDKKKRTEHVVLYQWLRVLVRYRLAVALFAFGFYKLFHLQLPYPPLSNLLTNYGDFYAWKVYFQTTAISPAYESFLGVVEILAGVLLLYRKTVVFAAGLVIGFLSNIAVVNGFYEVGEASFSALLVVFAIFLFIHDLPRLYQLLIREKYTLSNKIIPVYSTGKWKFIKKVVLFLVLILIGTLGLTAFHDGVQESYKLPKNPGLSDAFGQYDVKEFIWNGDTIPYSKTDSNRWQDVVFEKWSTLSIKVNRPVWIDRTSGEKYHEKDIDRNYELAGQAGRHYFYYDIDDSNHRLLLQNKSRGKRNEKFSLSFSRPDKQTILLKGVNEKQDSLQVVLKRSHKGHLMFEGRRTPVQL